MICEAFPNRIERTGQKPTGAETIIQVNDHCISAIITSYNKRDYLIEVINSVIRQTYHPNEIILADDGSRETI